jgi:hypothetical protein
VNGTARTPADAQGGVTGVEEYAARVREHLLGLTAEQVDDLTDGLEADLADALADGPVPGGEGQAGPVDLIARFGEPAAYASELRAAAGLPEPERVERVRGRARLARAVTSRARRVRDGVSGWLGTQPWWPAVRDLLVSVRPIWWLGRAWVGYQLLAVGFDVNRGWVPTTFGGTVLLFLLVLVSVQWGRGHWLPRPLRWAVPVTSVLAVVLLVPAVATAHSHSYGWRTEYVESGSAYVTQEDGVWVDGMQVSNLFVYDADGNPLDDVQIYDDRGRPVRTTTDDGWSSWSLPGVSGPWNFVAAQDEEGRSRWNVYPLRGAPTESFDWDSFYEGGDETVQLLDGETVRTPPRPFAKAPSLVELDATGRPVAEQAEQTDEADQDESPSPESSASPSVEPTPAS